MGEWRKRREEEEKRKKQKGLLGTRKSCGIREAGRERDVQKGEARATDKYISKAGP